LKRQKNVLVARDVNGGEGSETGGNGLRKHGNERREDGTLKSKTWRGARGGRKTRI